MHHELTALDGAATAPASSETGAGLMKRHGKGRHRALTAGGGAILSAMLGGCINVAAPEKPIVIELNVNIRQEVVYKLDKGVTDLIERNAEIF